MRNYLSKQLILPSLISWLWALLWFMLPVSRKGSVAVIWLLGLLVIIQSIIKKPMISKQQWWISLMLFALFAWHAYSLVFDPKQAEVMKNLERKLSLLVIPLILLLGSSHIQNIKTWALRGFFAGLFFTGMHMLLDAIIQSFQGFDMSKWMYHDFTSPYTLGAVYYSWYLAIAMISLVFDRQEAFIEKIRYYLLFFFLLLLLLSASKLFISLMIPLVFIGLFLKQGKKKRLIIAAIAFIMLMIAVVPYINRMKELSNSKLDVIFLKEYRYDTPLNGLTLRLIEWRFAWEIMQENDAWLRGVGIGSKQDILDDHYEKYNLYTGNPELGDRGYLGYNYHSQFVEITAGTGIPGLVILLLIFTYVFFCIRKQLFLPLPVYIISALFFLTESVLERQAGIVMFCLIVCTFKQKDIPASENNE